MKAAVYSGTRKVYKDIVPSLKSMLKNTSIERVYVLIEDDEFPEWLPECVEVRNVSRQEYFPKDGPNFGCYWTYMVLLRSAYFRMFPEYDRILSTDYDTIYLKDVPELWTMNMDRYYFAAVREPKKSSGRNYINAGIMLQNLEKMRDGKGDEIIRDLNEKHWAFPEQEAMNVLCEGHVYYLPGDYNYTEDGTTDPIMFAKKIIHYPGRAEWRNFPLVEQYRNMSWEEVLEGRHA